MSAKIDGNKWTAVSVSTLSYKNGILSIGGADSSNPPKAIGFAVRASRTGTYDIGSANSAVLAISAAAWQASIVGGTGNVKITSLTATGATGTFSFTLTPTPSTTASGNKVVTEGVFNVTFSTPISLSEQTSSSSAGTAPIAAKVNGEAWSGAFGPPATYNNRFFSITGFDSKGSTITMGIGQVTGPGTYSLAYGNTNGSSAIYANSGGNGWNTYLTGGTGSITITTLTATRAAGTFAFDAVPATGGAIGTVRITDGKFDVTLQQ